MEPQDPQGLADAAEAETEARYARLQALVDSLHEPIRRAEAAARLEAWLDTHPPPSRSSDRPLPE